MVLVVDDLLWTQWASKLSLHDEAVLQDVSTPAAHLSVARVNPATPVTGSSKGGEPLRFGGRLRQSLTTLYAQQADASPKFAQALGGADEAVDSWFGPTTRGVRTAADLARNLKRHIDWLREERLRISTRYARPARKTTGYEYNLSRAEQVALARRWADAGSTVLVSERAPVEQLGALGWEAVRIDGERRSQARTFGATEEWVTMNRTPVQRPSIQAPLFPVSR